MSNTTRTPEPQEPEVMPESWPPEGGMIGDHFRRHATAYVLAGLALTATLGAATLWQTLALRQEIGGVLRYVPPTENR